jgi:hypothetical protein
MNTIRTARLSPVPRGCRYTITRPLAPEWEPVPEMIEPVKVSRAGAESPDGPGVE